jgi:hypothetical protein
MFGQVDGKLNEIKSEVEKVNKLLSKAKLEVLK